MPHVNGNFYRQAGAGYAAEKGKAPEKKESSPAIEGEGGSKGSVIHVKHHGGGKFSVKHDDGQMSQHNSEEELHQHMSQHFGLQHEPAGDETEDYDMGGEDPLKSILG